MLIFLKIFRYLKQPKLKVMKRKKMVIFNLDGKNKIFPINYGSFMSNPQKINEFSLQDTYYLKIQGNLNGFFHGLIEGNNIQKLEAIDTKGEKSSLIYSNGIGINNRIIISTNEDLIRRVADLYFSQKTEIACQPFLVHKKCPVGYWFDPINTKDSPYLFITEEEFTNLTESGDNPFVLGSWVSVEQEKE